ncbi:hypothetical protein HGRIS_008892 [Hohenbuehelia grisea]|uniref:T6SS Phospholipase effector Tle1-like catalytic domain-containing protein n=1 Tax=Hohenbuehelia grisea TaxID=104357 RepID=A0ABR3IZV9_9AGAR
MEPPITREDATQTNTQFTAKFRHEANFYNSKVYPTLNNTGSSNINATFNNCTTNVTVLGNTPHFVNIHMVGSRADVTHLNNEPLDLNPNPAICAAFPCPHQSERPARKLVVCLDGTANQFSQKNTNIVELYASLEKDDFQLTYYNSGIGTYVKPSTASFSYWQQLFTSGMDMAFAFNLKGIVLNAYQWLSENYRDGDHIFLYGFSRGAYQVRIIAGMIDKVGLLHKGNNDQIPFAFELYISLAPDSNPADPSPPSSADQSQLMLCNVFKRALSHENVKVHFVGAWDTVSSVGLAREISLPETTTGMDHVCAFRHALALDERRVKFLPEYANGGDGPKPAQREDTDWSGVKEVWFAGSHSDMYVLPDASF